MNHLLLLSVTIFPLSFQVSLLEQLRWIDEPVPVCDRSLCDNSHVYCNSTLLTAVNYHELYNDSKTFVDMPMKNDPDYVLEKFQEEFGTHSIESIDKTKLQDFVDEHFSPAGSELLPCTPEDWDPQPPKLVAIVDPQLREWALLLNSAWRNLCKRIDPDIVNNTSRYSLIYLPNNFIMPGGRFREVYYWDAYWIIKGLIACDMHKSARAMIENLASLVERFGFVPNGGRVYYLQRSQPPLLAGMVYEYYEVTKDKEFITKMIPILEKELNFWNTNRMTTVEINGETHAVYQYNSRSNMPRPEAYTQDLKKALKVHYKAEYWQGLASAAESGWDFSTRWFSDRKLIYAVETKNILPVDLNAFMCWNFDILTYLYERIDDSVKSEFYRERRAKFRKTVHKVFYNETAGSWFDFNTRTGLHNQAFYPSIAVPLFTGCYNTLNQGKSARLFTLMKHIGVFEYPGGIPTSMVTSSEEQWDFPNGFSPMNHMIVEGLRKSQNAQMQDECAVVVALSQDYSLRKVIAKSAGYRQGYQLAKKWIMGNYKVWKETNHMWEKYNVIGDYPRPGSGGEYDVQDGFGWTNGAILDLLVTYNHRLHVE